MNRFGWFMVKNPQCLSRSREGESQWRLAVPSTSAPFVASRLAADASPQCNVERGNSYESLNEK